MLVPALKTARPHALVVAPTGVPAEQSASTVTDVVYEVVESGMRR